MRLLNDTSLIWLKNNIEENLDNYINNKSPWIDKKVDELPQCMIEQGDNLIISDDPSLDTENSIRFYEEYKQLTNVQASSEHYWTTLAHTRYYKYVHTRWNINEKSKVRNIRERFFFNPGNQKSRARHGLTRLWWIAHITYNEDDPKNPYKYTRLATADQELLNLIIETKYIARNKKALFAMLDVFDSVFNQSNSKNKTGFSKRAFYRETMQYINLVGSVTIWDMLTKEEAEGKLEKFARAYISEQSEKALV